MRIAILHPTPVQCSTQASNLRYNTAIVAKKLKSTIVVKSILKFTIIFFGGWLILQTVLVAIHREDAAFSPSIVYIGRSPVGKSFLYRININGDGRIQLTDVNSFRSAPSLSPDGSKLAYIIRDTVDQRGLWIMDIRTNSHQRFETYGMALDVAWSPQGDWIAYQTWASGYYVYQMHPDGAKNHAILPRDSEAEVPLWSPDGEWLTFYSCFRGCNIYRLQQDDKTIRPISQNFFVVYSDEDYAYSPDGEFLYIVVSQRIWRVEVETGQGEIIGYGQNVSVSPDGEWMVYEYRRDEEIFVVKLRTVGGEPIELARGWNPVWSPDGGWIVYGVGNPGESALFLMRPDGSDQYHLVEVGERLPDPQWSPSIHLKKWNRWKLAAFGGVLILIVPIFDQSTRRRMV